MRKVNTAASKQVSRVNKWENMTGSDLVQRSRLLTTWFPCYFCYPERRSTKGHLVVYFQQMYFSPFLPETTKQFS